MAGQARADSADLGGDGARAGRRARTVHILVNDAAPAAQVRALLDARRRAARRASTCTRCRPTTPGCATTGRPSSRGGRRRRELALVDWSYNAWGGKYPPWDHDDQVPRAIARAARAAGASRPASCSKAARSTSTARGTLLTTEACLLNPNRNPQLDRAEIEQYLRDYLGARHVLWLGDGIVGDDTDGHVDDLTRFVAPGAVVTVVEDDPRDENYAPSARQPRAACSAMRDAAGARCAIVTLPMPEPIYYDGHAPAGVLRELLHRQRGRARADLRQRARRARARDAARAVPRPAGRRHRRRRPGLGPRRLPLRDAAATRRSDGARCRDDVHRYACAALANTVRRYRPKPTATARREYRRSRRSRRDCRWPRRRAARRRRRTRKNATALPIRILWAVMRRMALSSVPQRGGAARRDTRRRAG